MTKPQVTSSGKRAPSISAPDPQDPCDSPPPGRPTLLTQEAESLALRFKALSDPSRLRILSIISSSPEAETCVCDLSDPLGLSQPTISHHLKIMVEAGLLHREKRGVWAYYSVAPGALEALAALLAPHS